jgi:hypothetical protein
MYEPFPVTSGVYVERLRKSMKSGGLIVIESFGEDATTPNRPPTAIDPGQLLAGVQGFSSAALRGHDGRARLGTTEEACCPHGRRKAAVRSV